MSSSFAGWTLEQIVGELTKAEVITCLPHGWIRARDVRKWQTLESAVLHLSDDLKCLIYQAARTKDKLKEDERVLRRKRKRENLAWSRRCRRRLGDGELTRVLLGWGFRR